MYQNNVGYFENWKTRLLCYCTSTLKVLGLECCYYRSYTNLKEYFLQDIIDLGSKYTCKTRYSTTLTNIFR